MPHARPASRRVPHRQVEPGSVNTAILLLSTFLASGVEMVEALTIVLAAGVVRGWRSSLSGAAVATLALAVLVGAFYPVLKQVPIGVTVASVGRDGRPRQVGRTKVGRRSWG